MKESEIQKKIAERLKKNGWWVTKLIQTTTNGIPDLMAIRNGHVIFLEVKQPGKDATELQQYVISTLNKVGVFARVVNCLEDVDIFCYKFQ
jgi:Holliday junction resolvase